MIDSYGFTRSDNEDIKSYEEFVHKYHQILDHRSSRWTSLLSHSMPQKDSRKLKRFIRKGIPSEHRPSMWMLLSGAERRMQENIGLYEELLKEEHDPLQVETIKKDIHRTFPDNIYFKGNDISSNAEQNNGEGLKEKDGCFSDADKEKGEAKEEKKGLIDVEGDKRGALYNVLLAVSHKNKHTGYCQGMNFVTGLLLLVVKDEAKVFWLVDTLINEILPDYYVPDMSGVKIDCEVLGQLIRLKCPEVYAMAESMGCVWPLVATKWFICLFVDVLPIETVLRLWDCLFLEGDKILFRVCITLIKRSAPLILKSSHFGQFMDAMKSMTKDPIVLDCHSFIESIFKDPGSFPKSLLEKLRQDYRIKNENGEL